NGAIEYIDTFMLTMAMTALGTDTSIDKFRQAGAKPFVLAFLLYIWIAGNYLNIKYQFYRSNHANKHMLSLIVNEVSTDEKEKSDYVNVEFRHNAYKDNQQILASGLVSFKLDKISGLLKGKKGLNIRINSLYDGERFRTINY
uniref:NigD1/NigD2 family lipoprotein n=1 Tax=Prevotella heparinolytica TaxID=28113 RepID=UPI0035A0B891